MEDRAGAARRAGALGANFFPDLPVEASAGSSTQLWFNDTLMTELPRADITASVSSNCRLEHSQRQVE